MILIIILLTFAALLGYIVGAGLGTASNVLMNNQIEKRITNKI